jgi:hypothetical protein
MPYDSGRQALARENALLEQLLSTSLEFERSMDKDDGVARVIVGGWAGSFAKLKKLNEDLMQESDADFAQALGAEKQLLQKLLATAKSSEGFAESWTELFQEDIAIVDGLLSK